MEHNKLIFSKVPTLRFRFNNDKWAEYPNSVLFSISSKKNHDGKESLVLSASQEKGMIPRNQNGIDIKYSKESVFTYKIIENGDYVIHLRSFQGGFAFSQFNGICSPAYTVLKPNKEILSNGFLENYFTSKKFIDSLRTVTFGIRDGKSISVDQWMTQSLFIPSKNEQEKIIAFIQKINNRIEVQNKIISDLKVLKKELCNRYFKSVHNDTSLEYVTLKDILTERKEYCGKDGTYTHGTLSKEGVSPKTERYDRDFLVKNEDKQYKVTHFNDICYNPANLKFGVICRNTYGDLIFSPIYVTFEIADTVYPAYIELFLTNANFIGRIRRYEQGTVYERMAVSPEDFLSYETHMPTYEKQVKFADKIQRIQGKIELETLFLNYLQKQRKYLLNAMFI